MHHLWQKKEKLSRDEFDRLTRPHVELLYRTALRMTADTHSAEDFVQETYLNAFRSLGSFEPGTNIKAWLMRILSNLIIDNNRRNAKMSFIEWDDQTSSDIWSRAHLELSRNPEVHILHKSFLTDACKAMTRLSPEIRMVVALAVLEEFSYSEIAESVGCPVGTVRSRLSRGRKQLQQELGEYLPAKKVSRPKPLAGSEGNKT